MLRSPGDESRKEPSSPGTNMLNSPDRRSPCARGKTMRDFEEELDVLRKENFDLKMRLYVLNEHIDLIQSVDNIEQIYEIHTNLKKEIAGLKADLAEKENLIVKAREAMNLLTNNHKEQIGQLMAKSEEDAEHYQEIIAKLKQENNARRRSIQFNTHDDFEDSSAMYAMAFALNDKKYGSSTSVKDDQLAVLEEQIYTMQDEIASKAKEIEDYKEKIQTLELELSDFKSQDSSLQEELKDKSKQLNEVIQEIREREVQVLSLNKKISDLEEIVNYRNAEIDLLKNKLSNVGGTDDTRDYYSCRNQKEKANFEKGHRNNENKQRKQYNKYHLQGEQENHICVCCRERLKLEEVLKEKELAIAELEDEKLKTLKAIQGFIIAKKALTKDVETLQAKLNLSEKLERRGSPEEGILDEGMKSTTATIGDAIYIKPTMNQIEEEFMTLANVLQEKDKKLKEYEDRLKEYEDRLKEYEEKLPESDRESRVNGLEAQILSMKGQMEELLNQGKEEAEKCLLSEIEAKDKCIEQLNEELRKRTFNLQELVNKELWDKNREIEKLNKLCEKKQNESMTLKTKLESQQNELSELNGKIQELSDNINLNLTKKDIDCLKEKLEEEIEKNQALAKKCSELEKDVIKSEKSRKELVNACLLLKTRLEELVYFMDSLIPSLAGKNRQILQDAIDRSREASSLCLSVFEDSSIHKVTIPILPDFSEVDFCEDTFGCKKLGEDGLINQMPTNNLKFHAENAVERDMNIKNSIPYTKIDEPSLFGDLTTMQHSLILDEITEGSIPEFPPSDASITSQSKMESGSKKNFPNADNVLKNINKTSEKVVHSESEGWSEPDRDVSKARIGIANETVTNVHDFCSSDNSGISDKINASTKRRYGPSEVRKLNLKIKHLGNVIEMLKSQRFSTSKLSSNESSSVSMEQLPIALLVEKVMEGRRQLDESLKHSEIILNQLQCLTVKESGKTDLEKEIENITSNLKRVCGLCQEMEIFLIKAESEKKDMCLKMFDSDRKLNSLNTIILKLQSELKEKENEVLEKQCSLLELKNEYILIESKGKNVESRLAEANNKLQDYLKNADMEKQACREKYASEFYKLHNKLKQKKEEYFKENNQLKELLKEANKTIDELNMLRLNVEDEFKQKLDQIVTESKAQIEEEINKRMDVEKKLVKSYEMQANLRNQLETELSNSRNIGSAQRKLESCWRKRLNDVEAAYIERESDLRRRLDASTFTTSQAVLERTRLANDKIKLQCELRRRDNTAHERIAALETRVSELQEVNVELEKKLACLAQTHSEPESPHNFSWQRSNPTSDYPTSDPDHHGSNINLWCGRSNNNCSPDLGIESDQGRLSSLDPIPSPKADGEMGQLKVENRELREQLGKTRLALNEVQCQLDASNHRKKQVDKAISRQINKTHRILAQARINLETTNQCNKF